MEKVNYPQFLRKISSMGDLYRMRISLLSQDEMWIDLMHDSKTGVVARIKLQEAFAPTFELPMLSPREDQTQANEEGWGLFSVDGRWQIQCVDEAGKFDNDADALVYVARRSAQSMYHRLAIIAVGQLVNP